MYIFDTRGRWVNWRHQWALWTYRDQVSYALSQWQITLHCNIVSHWLGACTEGSLYSTHLIQSSTFVSIAGRIDCYLNQWFKRYWCFAPPGALVLIGLDQYHHVLLVTLMRFVWCLWSKLGHGDLVRTLGQLIQMGYIAAVICYQITRFLSIHFYFSFWHAECWFTVPPSL